MDFVRTVPDSVWLAVAEATSNGFAESYLYGAYIDGGVLEPRTVIAYDALRRDSHAVAALASQRLVLKRPEPWRDGNGKRTAAECYGALSDAPTRRQAGGRR